MGSLNGVTESSSPSPGLYVLVFRSRRPEAKKFKRWITHIVIPEIRRTGVFLHVTKDMTDDEIMVMGFIANDMHFTPDIRILICSSKKEAINGAHTRRNQK